MKKQGLAILILMLWLSISCSNQEGSSQMISGETSKVWKATKELNRQGEKEKLSKEEKKEELRFYSNGTFTITGESDHQEGKWNFKQADKTLSLQFTGQDISENFKVLEMADDKMTLQTPDGSRMILETE